MTRCGIAVIKRGERIVKVLGDPDHPVSRGALCGKCAIAYNGVLRDPERAADSGRCGASAPRAKAQFEPVSWDTATGRDRRAAERKFWRRKGRPRSGTPTTPAPAPSSPAASPCASSTGWAPARWSPIPSATRRGTSALRIHLRQLQHRLRSPQHQGRRLRPALGHQPVGQRAPCPQALVQGGEGLPHRRRSRAPRHGAGGRSLSAGAAGHRQRARLRHAACDEARRPDRPEVPRRQQHRLGRGGAAARTLHAAMGRGADRRAGGRYRSGRRASSPTARRCCGWARGCSGSRWAATSSARCRCSAPPAAISASPAPGSITSTAAAGKGIDGAYVDGASLRRAPDNSVSHMDLCAKLEDQRGRARPLLLEHQYRGIEPGPGAAAARARPRGSADRGASISIRPTRRISPITCCRRRASWSSTISCRPIST